MINYNYNRSKRKEYFGIEKNLRHGNGHLHLPAMADFTFHLTSAVSIASTGIHRCFMSLIYGTIHLGSCYICANEMCLCL